VTLGRLVLAWIPVAVWFAIVWWLTGDRATRHLAWLGGEALVVTLLASLWFDSLGHGGWWLIFFLVGLLAGFGRLRAISQGASARSAVLLGLLDAARYVVAGGILAWRLA